MPERFSLYREGKFMATPYDVIIIGTGAGGGTLARHLAPSGKRILLLERGDWLPRELENWDGEAVFVQNRYISPDTWYDKESKAFQPQVHYCVGGATKLYGAAIYRQRKEDFGELRHHDGISPAWPISYEEMEPYYTKAEQLYQVHGVRGEDTTEPPYSAPYPYPAVSHEPRIQQLSDDLEKAGYHPFHSPNGIMLNEQNRPFSTCIRCATCDGFPCLVHAKSDAEVMGVRPALEYSNVTLLTNAKHPNGLANGSDQVGRNYMFHNSVAVLAVSKEPNPTQFQKTLGLNDFYFGMEGFEYPMGNIQMVGKSQASMYKGEKPIETKLAPMFALKDVARHAVDFWLSTEDLPDPNNRVTLDKEGKVTLCYTPNNVVAQQKLYDKLKSMLNHMGMHPDHLIPRNAYMKNYIPVAGVAHQAGTCRFGKDPKTSALDVNCKAHELDNLYVVETSFYPSISAMNPALTAIANALRVGDHLLERLK